MRLLLDTHILLWAAADRDRVPAPVADLMLDPSNSLHFSPASLWEVGIKRLKFPGFHVHPHDLAQHLLANSYVELPITARHAIATADLPTLHNDPFDRIMIAQAIVEQIVLITVDKMVGRYPGPIQRY